MIDKETSSTSASVANINGGSMATVSDESQEPVRWLSSRKTV